jgi:hypothetical protein
MTEAERKLRMDELEAIEAMLRECRESGNERLKFKLEDLRDEILQEFPEVRYWPGHYPGGTNGTDSRK